MNNPVVVITGATGATGMSAARAFAAQGASLALLSHEQAKLDALASSLNLPSSRLLTHAADLRSPDEVRAASRFVTTRFGRADILLHLVGGWTGGKTLPETSADDLAGMLNQHDLPPAPGLYPWYGGQRLGACDCGLLAACRQPIGQNERLCCRESRPGDTGVHPGTRTQRQRRDVQYYPCPLD